jgi:hypothetical protein
MQVHVAMNVFGTMIRPGDKSPVPGTVLWLGRPRDWIEVRSVGPADVPTIELVCGDGMPALGVGYSGVPTLIADIPFLVRPLTSANDS